MSLISNVSDDNQDRLSIQQSHESDYSVKIESIPEFIAQRQINMHELKKDSLKLYKLSNMGKCCNNCSAHNNLTDSCNNMRKKTLPDNVCVNHNKRMVGN